MRAIADDAVRASKAARRQRERRPRAASSAPDLLPAEIWHPDGSTEVVYPPDRMFPVEEW